MYKLTEYIESIEEASQGVLFKIEDFSFEHVNYKGSFLKIPETEYEMLRFHESKVDPTKNIFNQVDYEHPMVLTGEHVNKEYAYKVKVDEVEASRFSVPIFKEKTTYQFVIKCNQAYLYYKSSKQELKLIEDFYYWYNFYPGLMACKRAIDIYKNLIDEILPLFEESAREQVKATIYYHSITIFIDHACDFMEYVQKDINKHLKEYANYTTLPEIIESWENAINMVSALLIEVYSYVEIFDRYRRKNLLNEKLMGDKHCDASLADEYNPDSPGYNKRHIKLYKEKIKPVKDELENFCKLKPNGRPIINIEANPNTSAAGLRNNTETFVNKPPRAIVWAVNSFQSAQNYVSALYNSVANVNDEKVPLLEELKNYSPIYQAPKKSPIDESIDQCIILREKKLSMKATSINVETISSLAEFVKECCDALSLIKMRYSLSLNINNNSYFNVFETSSEHDQKAYSLIVESYIEKFIGVCLTAAINYFVEEKNSAVMLDLDMQNSNIDKLVEMIKSVQVYLYNADDKYPRSAEMLENLVNAAKNIPNAEQTYVLDVKQEHPTGLRRRYVQVSPV